MGLNIGGGLFGERKYGHDTTNYWLPWQHVLGEQLGSRLLRGLKSPWQKRYASPTPYEQMALGQLGNWMQGTPRGWTQSQQAMQRALTGEGYKDIIDPERTNELYSQIEKRTMEDILPQVLRESSNIANVGGMLTSGPGAQMQFDEMNKITNQLSETLAGLKYQDELQRREIEREREARQLSAIPAAMQLSEMPLRRVEAGMTYGSYPRQLMGYMFDNPLMAAVMQALQLMGTRSTRESQAGGGFNLSSQFGLPWE